MIAWLEGSVQFIEEDAIIINCNHVGYRVFLPGRHLLNTRIGEVTSVFIEPLIREDRFDLYGFPSSEERLAFRKLCTVQGVGARVGMAILSALSLSEIDIAVQAGDSAMLTRADGVGKKLATRIVTELKDKLVIQISPIASAQKVPGNAEFVESSAIQDAVSALVNLGYGRSEAYQAVQSSLAESINDNLPDLIRVALKKLAG